MLIDFVSVNSLRTVGALLEISHTAFLLCLGGVSNRLSLVNPAVSTLRTRRSLMSVRFLATSVAPIIACASYSLLSLRSPALRIMWTVSMVRIYYASTLYCSPYLNHTILMFISLLKDASYLNCFLFYVCSEINSSKLIVQCLATNSTFYFVPQISIRRMLKCNTVIFALVLQVSLIKYLHRNLLRWTSIEFLSLDKNGHYRN